LGCAERIREPFPAARIMILVLVIVVSLTISM
jgi:hypothetical protein